MERETTEKAGPGIGGVGELRARCERCLAALGELARIHLEVDAPTREIRAGEPDWVYRLRKVCLHVRASGGWEIGVDIEHVLAAELRAAYEQMDAVWKILPEDYRLEGLSAALWADEARNGTLATYDHPTPQNLLLRAGRGGFGEGEQAGAYAQVAVWLGGLGIGYGLALAYLAEVLDADRAVVSRLTTAVGAFAEQLQPG